MEVVLEGSDPNLSILGKAGTPITIETSYYFGGSNFETIDYFAPVYIAFFVFFFVFMLTSVSFLRERSRGTMERLPASPLSKLDNENLCLHYAFNLCQYCFTRCDDQKIWCS